MASVPETPSDGPAGEARVVLLDASGQALDDLWERLMPDGDMWRSPDPTVIPDGFDCALIALPVGETAASLDDLVGALRYRAADAIDGADPIHICVVWVIQDAARPDALIAHDYRTGVWRNAYRLGGAEAWRRQRAAASSDGHALGVLDARLAALLELPSHRTMLAGNTVAVLNHTRQLSGGRFHVVLLTQSAADSQRWHGEQWLNAAVGDLLQRKEFHEE